jgi:hypothetical protein
LDADKVIPNADFKVTAIFSKTNSECICKNKNHPNSFLNIKTSLLNPGRSNLNAGKRFKNDGRIEK